MEVAFGTVILALLIGVPLGIMQWRRWEGQKALAKIMAQVGGQLVSHQELRCKRYGHDVTFERDRAADSTSISVGMPAGYPLVLDVRRRTLGSILLPDGVPELKLGDHEFDLSFAVVAAPAAVVERLLGVEVRSFLLEHPECVILVRDGYLLVMGLGLLSANQAVAAIDLAAGFVAGIRDTFAALAEQAESIGLVDGDSPYRPIAVEAGPDLATAHAAEVRKLEALQRRAGWIQIVKMLALVVAAAGAIKLIALWNQR